MRLFFDLLVVMNLWIVLFWFLYLHIDVYAVQMLNILIPDYSLYFDLE